MIADCLRGLGGESENACFVGVGLNCGVFGAIGRAVGRAVGGRRSKEFVLIIGIFGQS